MPDIKHFDPEATLDTVVRLFWRQGFASTGIQDIVDATGLNRSSLYATYGGKQELYRAALDRYAASRSRPVLERLTADERGLPALRDFFSGLVETRCSGEYARWGCMISNAHAGAGNGDPEVLALLDRQHAALRDALRQTLLTARRLGQLAEGADPDTGAEMLALLAYGINLRSRAGVDVGRLRGTAMAAIDALAGTEA
ncbi:TetR/AcrR family transcriptional regulator [Streptomyces flavalbus]|uniref:TetR/AcrR family transcriptional regulator n=1 Tax=Streptomyces flavalbus TaxID=2665155 RepID=A0ABW2WHV6_9ACTN